MPANVKDVGHVYTKDHNAFNCTPVAVLNVNRESMARYGFSPATRVFEAAFVGIEEFFEPGVELLVAHTGDDVAEHVRTLTPDKARQIGQAALRRALASHTYDHRVARFEQLLGVRS